MMSSNHKKALILAIVMLALLIAGDIACGVGMMISYSNNTRVFTFCLIACLFVLALIIAYSVCLLGLIKEYFEEFGGDKNERN